MLARLWWKEWRVFGPLAASLALLALLAQWAALGSGEPLWRGEALTLLALGWTVLYAFAVSTAAFAGEREEATLRWLDAIPVARLTLWAGKASFAVGSTALLALLLALLAAWGTAAGVMAPYRYVVLLGGFAALLLEAIAWGLFWSSLLRNVLAAAALAVVCALTISGLLAVRSIVFHIDDHLVRAAPVRVAVACIVLPASWWFLVRPPRRARARPGWTGPSVAQLVATLRPRRRHSARRSMGWETRREATRTWVGLVLLCVVVPILWGLWVERPWREEYALFAVPACLLAGISVFHAENRGRTYRVYIHHGVSPARVWWVKARTWLLLLAVPWGVAWALGVPGYDVVPFMPVAFGAFAVGVLCGQIIERGVTATVLGFCVAVLLLAPCAALATLEMIPGWAVLLPPTVLLGISWGWTSDWMLRRPGRWVRLAVVLCVLFAGLLAAQAAYRAWSIPDRGRIAPPAVLPVANTGEEAAALYERAYAAFRQAPVDAAQRRGGMPGRPGRPVDTTADPEPAPVDYGRVILGEDDPNDPRLLAWWKTNERAIALARRGADRPVGGFPLPRTMLGQWGKAARPEWVLPSLAWLLAVDARENAAHGDLNAAWEDVHAVLRMARQVGDGGDSVRLLMAAALDRKASHMVMLWATNRRQTRDSLRTALAELRAAPERLPLADTLRTDAALWERTLRLPLDELHPLLTYLVPQSGLGRVGFALLARVFVNPWERERALRAGRLWFADLLDDADRESWLARGTDRAAVLHRLGVQPVGPRRVFAPGQAAHDATTAPQPSHRAAGNHALSPAEVEHAVATTPLVRWLLATEAGLVHSVDEATVDRRAAILVLALRSWALAHGGELPERLDALVPSELDRLPVDPYSGQAFGYEPGEVRMAKPLGWYAADAATTYRRDYDRAVRGERNLVSVGQGPGAEIVFPIPGRARPAAEPVAPPERP